MSEKAEKKRKLPLSKEEYSALVVAVSLAMIVAIVVGILIFRFVRLCVHAG